MRDEIKYGLMGFGALVLGIPLMKFIKRRKLDFLMREKGHGKRYDYVIKNGLRVNKNQKDLIEETKEKFPREAVMLGGRDAASLMASMIRI